SNSGNGNIATSSGVTIGEMFIVMKMRESSFANPEYVCVDSGLSPQILVGSLDNTYFTNQSFSATAFTYRLNGLAYPQTNMKAPMNAWGIVHVRNAANWTVASSLVFGGSSSHKAFMDVAEILYFNAAIPASLGREITEYLAV